MARNIIFRNKTALEVDKERMTSLRAFEIGWIHLLETEDNVKDVVERELKQSASFLEDIIEDQRPRLDDYGKYTVAVLAMPTKKITQYDIDEWGTMQIAFILMNNKIISISEEKSELMTKILSHFLSKKLKNVTPSIIFSKIVEEMAEQTIDIMEEVDKKIDNLKNTLMKDKNPGKVLERVESLKENLFFTKKLLLANRDVMEEIMDGDGKYIMLREFNKHIEDRFLYSMDYVDILRDSLNGVSSIYLATLSNRMNEHIYTLTIIGSMLIIPTIIGSFWGMNVDLPFRNFWGLVTISLIFSGVLAIFLLALRKKL